MVKNKGSIEEIRKKVTKTYDLISTNYHEAAHAVYALLHFMRVSSVFIYEDKKNKRIYGTTYYDYPGDFDSITDPELLNYLIKSEIGVNYAGLIAEKALFKTLSGSNRIPMFIMDGSSEDNKAAAKIIKQYNLAPPGRKRYLFKQKLCREVLSELCIHWDAVSIVAHGLFRYHKLDYQDLKNLLIKKTRNKKFWKEQFKKLDSKISS